MTKLSSHLTVTALLFSLFAGLHLGAAAPNESLNFQEVYGLIRSNLPAASEVELDAASVSGLLSQLRNRVLLATNESAATSAESELPAVTKTKVIEGGYGYVRIGQVRAGLGQEFDKTYAALSSTNKLKGLVLDLRFTKGADYAATAEVADRFVEKEQSLFKIGEKETRSQGRTDPITLPVAVLVNRETIGAAEVLAATLRQIEAGLIIGGTTAGQARPFRDFPLSNGQTLRIASGTVELADGKELSEALVPDLRVTIGLAQERGFLEDPYAMSRSVNLASNPAGNNRGSGIVASDPRRRMNEAELVRMQREGIGVSTEPPASTAPEPSSQPIIQDPVLGRAVDFLKGVAAARARR